MSLNETNNNKNFNFSFEIFPPKDDITGEKTENLYKEIDVLNKHNPTLFSVTFGAGGSNKDLSFGIVKHLINNNIEVMPHFTSICTSTAQINERLEELKKLNVKNILALRGDEPKDITVCYPDFRYANQLVKYIKQNTNFNISVACYPEGHIEAENLDKDIINFKHKVDEGAVQAFSQMFFDNSKFMFFLDKVYKTGINIPIIPGILPVTSYKQINKMLSLARVTFPKNLMEKLEKYQNDKYAMSQIGIEFATKQCLELLEKYGINNFHFYTLNKSFAVDEIIKNLK